MRRIGQGFGDHAFDLFDLFHQMRLRGQPPGGVGQHHIDVARLRGMHRIVDHRRRIAALLRDDGDVVALAPGDELFARRRAKGVARRQQYRQALALQIFRQLADGRGLARAIDTHHHDDERFMGMG